MQQGTANHEVNLINTHLMQIGGTRQAFIRTTASPAIFFCFSIPQITLSH